MSTLNMKIMLLIKIKLMMINFLLDGKGRGPSCRSSRHACTHRGLECFSCFENFKTRRNRWTRSHYNQPSGNSFKKLGRSTNKNIFTVKLGYDKLDHQYLFGIEMTFL